MHNVVLTGDIEKMFRQISVEEKDRNYQCIVWREEPKDELKHTNLTQ